MKKLVAFTTVLLVVLLAVLGVIMLKQGNIIDFKNISIGAKSAQEEETEAEEDTSYYDGALLRTQSQMERVTYEGEDFTIEFVNPFYEEGSTNYINVMFYDKQYGILLESLGQGDDSEFFNTYKTEDGGSTWNQCAGELWFSLNGSNHLEMISATELLYVSQTKDEVLDTTVTSISYSPDMGETWIKYEPESGSSVANADEVRQIMENLTTEQKVAMLFMLTPEELINMTGVYQAGPTTSEKLETYPVSGILITEDNIQYGSQLTEMMENLQEYSEEYSGLPMFLAVSEEGGDAAVLSGNDALGETDTTIQSMSNIGKDNDEKAAYSAGKALADIVSKYGLNMDLAPVADVLGGNSEQMGTRILSTDAQTVSDLSNQIMKGIQDEGVIAVMKYFPGYGSASEAEGSFPVIQSTVDDMMEKEFLPYINAIADGAQCIMVGHITVPDVTGEDTPSSLSSAMIQDVLRDQLGFKGVIMTDSLSDELITSKYTSAEAAVAAIEAGADMIVSPENFEEAYQGVLDAVNKGDITEERLEQSVYRILSLRSTLSTDSDSEEE